MVHVSVILALSSALWLSLYVTTASAFPTQDYRKHHLFRVYTQTPKHVHLLKSFAERHPDEVVLWKRSSHGDGAVDLLVTPTQADYVRQLVKMLRMYHEEAPLPAFETPTPGEWQRERDYRTVDELPEEMPLDQYHTYDEVNTWLTEMAKQYGRVMSVLEIGRSWEGRAILAVKISSSDADDISSTSKPAIWLDAGIHSDEWIGPATLLYFINQLVTRYGKDSAITRQVDMLDWFILPIFNVDGYVYTWKHDRSWRKSRSVHSNDTGCVGVDMNRNWDIGWEEHLGVGIHPCSRIYPGPRPFSEPELRAVVQFLREHPNIVSAVSYHSCGQMWMTPYGYPNGIIHKHFQTLVNISNKTANAIRKVHGTNYQTGSIQQMFGATSGSSVDYMYGRLGIRYAFGVELRDKGRYCALLPPQQIIPNAEESFSGIRCLATLVAVQTRQLPESQRFIATLANC